MNNSATEIPPTSAALPRRRVVITALGLTQILAWGSSYYLLAVLAKPITANTGWPLAWVVGGLSLGLLIAGMISPRVGDAIERRGGRPVLAVSAVLLALGLAGLALAPNLSAYIAAWLILGLGMGAGLYDAAFATLICRTNYKVMNGLVGFLVDECCADAKGCPPIARLVRAR